MRFSLTRAAWRSLFGGSLVLAACAFALRAYFGAVSDLLGADGALGGTAACTAVGALALAGAAALWRLRPRRQLPLYASMPCGGVLTEASFAGGATYGYCSKRCVHSRADFEARRSVVEI